MRLGLLLVILTIFSSSLRAEIKGCMQPLADNYNSAATIENGACKFSVCYFPGDSKYSKEKLDLIRSYKYGGHQVKQVCANDSACKIDALKAQAKFAVLNPAGQVSTDCCSAKLTAEGKKITCNPQNFTNECWCKGSEVGGEVVIPGHNTGGTKKAGCMERLADNYDKDAKQDNESCKFSFCSDSKYVEFDSTLNRLKKLAYEAYSKKAKVTVNAPISTCKRMKSGAGGVGSGSGSGSDSVGSDG